MKWMSRILCMILACVMLLGVVGCRKKGDDAGGTTGSGVADTTQDVTKLQPDEIFSLSSDVYYGEGKQFRMLLLDESLREKATSEWYVGEELTAEHNVVDKAVYTRNESVKARLGIEFKYLWVTTKKDDILTRYRRDADLNEFDICGLGAAQAPTLITEDLCYNLLEMPNLDLDKVWWGSRSGMAKDLTINKKLYMISGDASLMAQGKAMACYVNVFKLRDYAKMEVSDLYDEINAGKWTIDRLLEISKSASVNLDGNATWNEADFYGNNIYLATIIDNWFSAFDIDILTKDANGMLQIGMDATKMTTATEKLHALCYDDHRTYMTTDREASESFFKSGHSVFTHGGFEWAENFQDMNDDYGIIPYAKLNENQEQYGATLSDVYTAFVVPKGCADPSFVGAVMETIGYYSYNVTTPAYYETLLKVRSTRDEESKAMLDLIHDVIDYNPGFVYSTDLGKPGQAFRTLLAKGNQYEGNYTSWWQSTVGGVTLGLNKMIAFYYPEMN
ncbi:MAG: hypothetical protein IJX94_02785 [Clostridia bacterium]|nr:hypothetical protein [Clostridia bacterium]